MRLTQLILQRIPPVYAIQTASSSLHSARCAIPLASSLRPAKLSAAASNFHFRRTLSVASVAPGKDNSLNSTRESIASMDKEERNSEEHKVGTWHCFPDLQLRDHRFTVPLDYKSPAGGVITVFAREVVGAGKEEKLLPYLLYLQGGPGFESPRPVESSGWLKKACEEYRSYGGFCAVTYLSFAPKGLKHVLLTGGLPPLDNGCTADAVYKACYKRVVLQNQKYYERFPQDREIVREVILHLAEYEGMGVPLPSGGTLTPWGLQLLGLSGLGSSGGFERLHYMFERAWDPVMVPGTKKQLSYSFMKAMVFPWMFDEIAILHPLKEAAHTLAEKEDWPLLYDIDRLKQNQVPVAAAVYYEDMYVNFHIAEATAAQIAGIRLWITNEYMHSGLRDGGSHVFDYLMGMLKGKKPVF